MRYGIDVCILGDLADPARTVELAQAAEAAGWEAVFVWDHLAFTWGTPSGDPWVTLAAAAQATSRPLLGTAVTPLPRRRPVSVAHAVATLDVLSGGRAVLGVGIGGVPVEFSAFGEPDGAGPRARRLDEALDVITGLWSGDPLTHEGEHYRVRGVTLAPVPVQRPRVPVWVGGDSPPALRRAARWDGWIVGGDDERGRMVLPPETVAERVAYVHRHRRDGGPFEVALAGVTAGPDDPLPHRYAEAGVTWWLEHIHRSRSYQASLDRIAQGPAC
jgi:probable F420-dependent oxidoreductase